MDNQVSTLLWLILGSLAVSAAIVIGQWRQGAVGVGLTLSYLISLQLIHLPGAVIYALPWYSTSDYDFVVSGFRESTIGLAGFGIGASLVAPFVFRHITSRTSDRVALSPKVFSNGYLVVGLVAYFVLMPIFGGLPTVTALLAAGFGFMLVGLCLRLWTAWKDGRRDVFYRWLAATLVLPVVTMVFQGFLGYGTLYVSIVFCFVITFYKPRAVILAVSLVFAYVAVSFFVTYLRDRSVLRGMIAEGQGYTVRLNQVWDTITSVEPFDPYDEEHLARIDSRLNQNILVGAAVEYIADGREDFAGGDTLYDAVISIVPRALWPNKPVVAGSQDLVTRYTGIYFAEGTSVGVGQVLEFYVNFGSGGVLAGFLVLGFVIASLDIVAARYLHGGQYPIFGACFLVGFSFINAGGSLVEVTAGAAAAVVMATGVNWFILRKSRSRVPAAPLGQSLDTPV